MSAPEVPDVSSPAATSGRELCCNRLRRVRNLHEFYALSAGGRHDVINAAFDRVAEYGLAHMAFVESV